MTAEQLLLLLIVFLVWLAGAAVQWVRARRRPQEARETPSRTPGPAGLRVRPPARGPELKRARSLEPLPRQVAGDDSRRAPSPARAPRAPVRQPGRQAARLFRGRAGLRQAIVLSAVLGPCRALERDHREP